MKAPLNICIGYDAREHDAWEVCRASLLRHATVPLNIVRLDQDGLRTAGWFTRRWQSEGQNRVDMNDLKPFSTDFAFTRFLVPALNLYNGWALFCDCDFLFTRDIAEVFTLVDNKYAALCVKHEHVPLIEETKMGGVANSRYRRKNWSSMTLWNCSHIANRALTGYVVNNWAGSWLHAFSWLRDDEIGEIPQTWNWLSGVDEPLEKTPAGIHFTLGTPVMPGCENMPYAALWRSVRESTEARSEAA